MESVKEYNTTLEYIVPFYTTNYNIYNGRRTGLRKAVMPKHMERYLERTKIQNDTMITFQQFSVIELRMNLKLHQRQL